ncbi:TPA: ParA family protein [Legionella bozemanae]|uniref:Chromosome partitioning protein ParA n=2 Tax=Legionellaceae TaxID=444 RepID=A0A0W0RF65_LEGBO|nr:MULTISPECIES: ParA family protein [Legionellaceae]HCX3330803.1 ParA family protein [Legionella pneumophila]KTC69750.1 chromosome partitioning protein ParA [Legionella bozemanae]MCW8485136.1 ParA family protein [Fluoribacter dumoffii]STP13977.1 Sporulation initiation inhibitor protein soj [Legionella bozemanae]BAF92630.1 putative cobyrinic acid a,c-diamide synthase [Fluoribacter dumoffii Tex-KL]
MEQLTWTNSDIRKLFKMDNRFKSIQTLYNAEDRGEIPIAEREPRGKVSTRLWKLEQLPEIGKRFGFLKTPLEQKILCTYMQKGGVYKTTTSYNRARTLALNGMKVLLIGLDPECSVTDIIIPQQELNRLDDFEQGIGLFHYFVEGAPLKDIIRPTSLPTLDFIPETHDLVKLNKWMTHEKRREYIFQDKLIHSLSDYDVVIFDNSPTWNHLVENSILVSSAVIMPLGCSLLAYNASATNMQNIWDFQEVMKLTNQKLIMFSTALERSSLSQQINATYLTRYVDYMITTPIRKSVKWEEALMSKQTILEYALGSPQAEEYYHLITEEWARINGSREKFVDLILTNELEVV